MKLVKILIFVVVVVVNLLWDTQLVVQILLLLEANESFWVVVVDMIYTIIHTLLHSMELLKRSPKTTSILIKSLIS